MARTYLLRRRPPPVASLALTAERFTLPRLRGVHLAAIRHGDPGRPARRAAPRSGRERPLVGPSGARPRRAFPRGRPRLPRPRRLRLPRGAGARRVPRRPRGAARAPRRVRTRPSSATASARTSPSATSRAARRPRALVLIDPTRGASATRRRATRLALSLRPTYASRERGAAPLPVPARARRRRRSAARRGRRALGPRRARAAASASSSTRAGSASPTATARSLGGVRAPTLILRGDAEPAAYRRPAPTSSCAASPARRLVERPGRGPPRPDGAAGRVPGRDALLPGATLARVIDPARGLPLRRRALRGGRRRRVGRGLQLLDLRARRPTCTGTCRASASAC